MTDPGITLNIYNRPPQIEEENDKNDNNNQNETNENINNEIPPDNLRIDATSAPRANNLQTMDNTRNEMVDTIKNNQSSLPPNPEQQYQGRPMQIYAYQNPPIRPVQPMMVVPAQQQVIPQYNAPYNMQYTPSPYQPVIIQQPPKKPPQRVIIQEKQKKDNTAKNCFGGFFAGCCAALTACCLLSLCASGGRRRGRW